MSASPCDLFKALLEDLENNPQDPMLAKLERAERAALRAHVQGCDACLDAYDNVDYPADEGLTDDMNTELVGFLAGSEEEPPDEETEELIDADPGLKPDKWGMNLVFDAWELKVARFAMRLCRDEYERQLAVTGRLISRGEDDHAAIPRAAIRLAWVRAAVRRKSDYVRRKERS